MEVEQQPRAGQKGSRATENKVLLLLFLVLATLASGIVSTPLRAAETNSPMANWFSAQSKVQTWSADFLQTRTFKSLTQPLTATGHVWFAKPGNFRWELGNPPQTIAVRKAAEMLVVYPPLKRAERYPLKGIQNTQWRDTLALLDAGFPQSQSEMEARYKIISQKEANSIHELTLEPKSASARKMMPRMKIGFDAKDYTLKMTELQFADGSMMRNDFTNTVMNPKIDDKLFAPELGTDFKIVEPLKK